MVATRDLMTIAEAAERLCVDSDTIRRWIAKGVFKRTVRVGPQRRLRLYREDVEAERREQRA